MNCLWERDWMSSLNKHISFSMAREEDSQKILEMLEESAFKGAIELQYTRRPNAYQSLKKEGRPVNIIICRDTRKNRIAGLGAIAFRKLFVNGEVRTVGYMFGLRLRRAYLHSVFISRAYQWMHENEPAGKTDFYLTTILAENQHARRMLEKRRTFMPDYEYLGEYRAYALKTGGIKKREHDFTFRKARTEDLKKLTEFINREGRRYNFFPVLRDEDISGGQYPGLSAGDFYLLMDRQGEINAAGAAWDQRSYKQYVVKKYNGILKLCYPFSFLFPLFNMPRLPQPGSVLDFFTLSFWMVKGDDQDIAKLFLDEITRQCSCFSFFLAGVHETSPLCDVLAKRPHIQYKSRTYLVNWEKEKILKESVSKTRPLYMECATL